MAYFLKKFPLVPNLQNLRKWAISVSEKPALCQRLTSKHLTSMSCKVEAAIWSRDAGQRITCFGICQLIITWMSNIEEVQVNQFYISLSTHYLEYGRHIARLHRRRRAYAPTSNTASHDNHENINSWGSAWRPGRRSSDKNVA